MTSSSQYDIIIGGLQYMNESKARYVFATPYYRDDLTWCVRAALRVPGWLVLILTFHDWQTFLLTVITFFIIIYLWYIYSAFDGTNLDIWKIGLMVYNIILAMSCTFKPKNSYEKYMFYVGSWEASVLIIIFSSISTSYIAVPLRFNQVRTTQQLIEKDFQLCGALNAFHELHYDGQVKNKFCRISSKLILVYYSHSQIPASRIDDMAIEIDIDDCLRRLHYNFDLAVAVSRQYALNQRILSQSKMYCFDETENIHNYHVSLYMRKGHSAEMKILEHLRRVYESGLIEKWRRDSRINYLYDAEDLTRMSRKLTMSHLYGGLFMYALCLCISFVAFIGECVVHRRLRCRKPKTGWKWLDMFIDSDRHFMILKKR